MDDDQLQQEWSECVKESDNGLFCEQWSSVSATVSDDYTFDDGDLELRGKLLFLCSSSSASYRVGELDVVTLRAAVQTVFARSRTVRRWTTTTMTASTATI
mgnify:CR=1 FL=1